MKERSILFIGATGTPHHLRSKNRIASLSSAKRYMTYGSGCETRSLSEGGQVHGAVVVLEERICPPPGNYPRFPRIDKHPWRRRIQKRGTRKAFPESPIGGRCRNADSPPVDLRVADAPYSGCASVYTNAYGGFMDIEGDPQNKLRL
jgi:hypothetical protein